MVGNCSIRRHFPARLVSLSVPVENLNVVIRRDALFDLEDNLSGLVGAFRFEIIALGLCGFVYDNLHKISRTTHTTVTWDVP